MSTFEFMRHFPRYSKQPCLVKKRGKPVGQWLPIPADIEPVDIMRRLKEDFPAGPLPFTGAALLKAGKKR